MLILSHCRPIQNYEIRLYSGLYGKYTTGCTNGLVQYAISGVPQIKQVWYHVKQDRGVTAWEAGRERHGLSALRRYPFPDPHTARCSGS